MKQTIIKTQSSILSLLSNLKLFLIGTLIFINSSPVAASHIAGGEITWECLSSSAGGNAGMYIFQLKLYRDCQGIPLGDAQQVIDVVNHPALTSINCMYVISNDLSPAGCGYSCSNPQSNYGVVEENIYRSAPISLGNYIPPAQGWIFYWGANQCCRTSTINLTGANQMLLRSKMFAYNGKPASPCFDSSPYVAENPVNVICIGSTQSFNLDGVDSDGDTLTYDWDHSTDGSSWTTVVQLPYTLPYSVSNPLPGSPLLNRANGSLTLSTVIGLSPQGNYSSIVRVDAYRCQQKIAEVYRETQINFSNCPILLTGPNTPPGMYPGPFTDPNTGLNTEYDTTIFAGDTIAFNFVVSDYDIKLTGSFQTAFLDVAGSEFASDYATSPPSNCLRPPCAYLTDTATPFPVFIPPIATNPPTPFKAVRFFWPTACNHVWIDSCGNNSHTYYFSLKAYDDFCPVPANNTRTVGITVLGPQVTVQGSTLSTNFPNGSLQWYFNGAIIPGATSSSYIATVAGTYQVAATIPGSNCQAFSAPRTAGTSSIANSQNPNLDITIFPNPASEQITLEINSKEKTDVDFILNDLSGRNVMTKQVIVNEGNNKVGINMTGLQKGIYIARIRSAEMEQIKKLVLE